MDEDVCLGFFVSTNHLTQVYFKQVRLISTRVKNGHCAVKPAILKLRLCHENEKTHDKGERQN